MDIALIESSTERPATFVLVSCGYGLWERESFPHQFLNISGVFTLAKVPPAANLANPMNPRPGLATEKVQLTWRHRGW